MVFSEKMWHTSTGRLSYADSLASVHLDVMLEDMLGNETYGCDCVTDGTPAFSPEAVLPL